MDVAKLNIDGKFMEDKNVMRCGGLIRTTKGDWVAGFSSYGGAGVALLAELQAVEHGLNLAWRWGLRKIVCETDSLYVVHLLHYTNLQSFHVFASLIARIMDLMRRDWNISLVHAFREADVRVDALAKRGARDGCDWKFWEDPPK